MTKTELAQAAPSVARARATQLTLRLGRARRTVNGGIVIGRDFR